MRKVDLWFNKRWINNEMGAGSRTIDIGEPPVMPPSDYYNVGTGPGPWVLELLPGPTAMIRIRLELPA